MAKRKSRLLGAALSAFTSLASMSPAERAQTTERITETAEPSDEGQEQSAGAETEQRMVAWKGKQYAAEKFNDILMAGFREILGSLADRCADAEQCYYYYADQLNTDSEPLAALTGKSKEELEWIGGAIRRGFMRSPGVRFPGTYVGVEGVGQDVLPPMPKPDRQELYQEWYGEHVERLSDWYEHFRIEELGDRERQAVKERAAAALQKATELAAMGVQVRYTAEDSSDFQKWFVEGVDPSLPTGEEKWEKPEKEYIGALRELYGDTPDGQDAVLDAERDYRMARLDLFDALARKAAQRGFFARREASGWADRVREESAVLAGLEKSEKPGVASASLLP